MNTGFKKIMLYGDGRSYAVGSFFARALKRLEYEFVFFDESSYLKPLERSLFQKLAYRLLRGRPLVYRQLNQDVLETVQHFQPDVLIIVKGNFISPATLAEIKRSTSTILVNFATDDPFNKRVARSDLVTGIPCYDLYVCTSRGFINDVQQAGAKKVTYMRWAYEPNLHFREIPNSAEQKARFCSDVVFIGGADSDRVPMIQALTTVSNLNLSLYGGYWHRFEELKPYYRGMALDSDYRMALAGGKIGLNLVRRANRAGTVMRSFELPACGGFMLADRTEEHLELFKEGREAAYFGSAEEMLAKIDYYLKHPTERQRIAEAGYRLVTEGKHTYQDRLEEILQHLN